MGFKGREGFSCSSGVVHDIGRPRASSTRREKVTTDRRLPRNDLFGRAHHFRELWSRLWLNWQEGGPSHEPASR